MIITTSWDDGHPLDLKMAELLDKYGIKATFYVPSKNAENIVMKDHQLRNLAEKFEIGGHTVNHIYLNTLKQSEAKNEITNCKSILQDKLGREISAFCFPGGKFSRRDIKLVQNAGFSFGRTTALFNTSIDKKHAIMNTSTQAYNHNYYTLLKHCLKRNFFTPIIKYNFFKPFDKNFQKLSKAVVLESINTEGIFHLWGHSWEIEKYELWDELTETFKMLANENNTKFLNNSECWNQSINSKPSYEEEK